jgi:CBS-domain-containing membrane protein
MASSTSRIHAYFAKWLGEKDQYAGRHEMPSYIALASLGAFLAIAFIACLSYLITDDENGDLLTPIGSMGASAILIFGAPHSPFSQPRNHLGGHVIAALTGTICRLYIAQPMNNKAFATALSVGLSFLLMFLTRTVNPPAGGTAAIMVISDPAIDRLGFRVVLPVFVEACIMILLACLVINLHPKKSYPRFWFWGKENLAMQWWAARNERQARDLPSSTALPPDQPPQSDSIAKV